MHNFSVKNQLLLLTFLLSFLLSSAQIQIGNWREHLSYRNGVALCKAENKIYCAAYPALFYFDVSDNSIQKISKVDGLSDLEVNVVKYSETYNTLIIGYNNGNIDLIVDNKIINVPDIKRSFIQGDKAINEILVADKIAYLGPGFGIISLNIERQEINETYALGAGGTFLSVNETCIKNDTIFAAAKDGVYFGSLNANLVDFKNWIKMPGLPEGNYNSIVNFNNDLLTNFRMEGGWQQDTIYQYKNNVWAKKAIGANYQNSNLQDLNVSENNELLVAFDFGGEIINSNYVSKSIIFQYDSDYTGIQPSEIIADGTTYWIADKFFALAHRKLEFSHDVFIPSGPEFSNTWGLDYSEGSLWLGTGTLTNNMKYSFLNRGIAQLKDNEWSNYYGGSVFDSLRDVHAVAIHPDDPNHVFAASYGGGVLEWKDGKRVKIYNETNSTVQSHPAFPFRPIGGITFDGNKNLWCSNSGPVANPLLVLSNEGDWYSYSLNNIQATGESAVKEIIVDKNNNKWIAAYLKGVIVFNENQTFGDSDDDSFILLNSSENSGNLPTNEINTIREDNDGKIWIGTSAGLVVINNTQSIFEAGTTTAEKIIIEVDGEASYLLGDEVINSIKIDQGNRKWIGTAGSGVFLFSADMQTEIHHFTTLNSPLLSDIIYDIEIDDKTGEVYFSTEKGLCSFMGTATDSDVYDGPLYAYPNPVPPNYNGLIGIKGIINNAEVKITDVSGNLVYETIANGGTATWDGKSLNGNRVQTGVYIVHISNSDGSEKQIAKILFVN